VVLAIFILSGYFNGLPHAIGALRQTQGQAAATPPAQDARRQPPGGDRSRGPADRMEAEQLMRKAMIANLRQSLALPDSQMDVLAGIAFRYRDSSLVVQQRERMIREMLSREGGSGGGRRGGAVDDTRITCLIGAFWDAQETRLALRRAEDREVAALLTPTNRYRYLAFQDNLHDVIDEFVDQMNRQKSLGRSTGNSPRQRNSMQRISRPF
jgi:hypothetical protein